MESTGISIRLVLEQRRRIEFDTRLFKVGLRKAANKVKIEAKRNLSRRAISEPGQFPGFRTGESRRAIRTRVSKSGWTAIVDAQRTPGFAARKFHPVILVHGVPGRIAPRKDAIKAALDAKRGQVESLIATALEEAL